MTLQKSKMASQAGLKEVVSLYQTLIKEWNRKPVDLEKVGKLLSGMKVSKISFRLFVFRLSVDLVLPTWPFNLHLPNSNVSGMTKKCSFFFLKIY